MASTTVMSAAHADSGGYTAEVQDMFRVAACGSTSAIPKRFSKPIVDSHCARMADIYAWYRKSWVDKAKPYIAKLRPSDAPTTVVYPFGGGDLSSALSVFPDATELTTISLEAAGDIRTIDTIDREHFKADLATTSKSIGKLYSSAYSATLNLMIASHSRLPGTIMFALAGLAVHDMEPLELRYFELQPDGTIRYLTADELDNREAALAAHRKKQHSKHFWYEQTSAFANVEITFRPRSQPGATPRVYRHILANLDDTHMNADDRLLQHLRAKGAVSVMTKAASFLLWWDDFSQIRDQLLASAAWMISDASGIPPRYASPAGYEEITYGDFVGPYFTQDPINARAEFVKLWQTQPHRELPFRFGYPDKDKHNHMLVMRPKHRGHTQ
ncbi:MAG TPA: hypothetical protein VIV40_34655 [Kofleriaceae bacterium]